MKEKMRTFESSKVGRQINTGVLFFINEIEHSIYRFLVSKAKNAKKHS